MSNLLNIKGVKRISKETQQYIKGGNDWYCSSNDCTMYWRYLDPALTWTAHSPYCVCGSGEEAFFESAVYEG